MRRGPPAPGPRPAPAAPPGQGPAPSQRHTSRFRQDSTPKRGSEGAGEANRKKTTTDRKHCLFLCFCFSGKLLKFLSKVEAPCGGTTTVQTPALAFHLCDVL